MKKTLGLMALSFGLIGAGCALMPQSAVKNMTTAPTASSSMSGPVTLRFHVPKTGFNTQALQDSSIKQAEVRIYVGDGATTGTAYADPAGETYAGLAGSSGAYNGRAQIAKNTSNNTPLVATYSVGVGSSSITVPSLPQGKYIIELNFYTTKATLYSTSTGLPLPTAPSYLAAQSEAFVASLPGAPLSPSFTVYSCLPGQYNIDTSTFTRGATTSIGYTGSSLSGAWAGASEYGLRIADSNLFTQIATGTATLGTNNKKVVRVILTPSGGQAIGSTIASDSADYTGDFWTVYDVNGTSAPLASKSFTWHFDYELGAGSSDHKFLWADLDLTTAGVDNGSFHTATASVASRLKSGSLSLNFSPTFINQLASSPDIRIIDIASGSSGVVSGGF